MAISCDVAGSFKGLRMSKLEKIVVSAWQSFLDSFNKGDQEWLSDVIQKHAAAGE